MDDLSVFLLGGAIALFIKSLSKKPSTKEQIGGGNDEIHLENINPGDPKEEPEKGIDVYDNESKQKYSPMYHHPKNAKKASKTNSTHLVIPGLLPASNRTWKDFPKNKVFYMPNDLKPHFHGDAEHHKADKGFGIDKVFLVSSKDFKEVPNKQLKEYRRKLVGFNNGFSNTPIETWIHWRIPYDKKDYPELFVKKDSIIWWDFDNMHNLKLVSEDNYENNITDDSDILISDDPKELQVIVTIMDKVGKYYFMCTRTGHAEAGHKIIINVV